MFLKCGNKKMWQADYSFFYSKSSNKMNNTTLLSLFLGLIFKVKFTLYLHYVYVSKNEGKNYETKKRQNFQPLIIILIHKYCKYTCTYTHTYNVIYCVCVCVCVCV
jgi:hypothetical protein